MGPGRRPRLSTPALAGWRAQALAGWRALALAAALLAGQGLGLVHRVVHAGPPSAAEQGQLFADHDAGSEQCRLLDQLLADPLPVPVLAQAPVAAEPAPAERGAAQRGATGRPPYGARAPPR